MTKRKATSKASAVEQQAELWGNAQFIGRTTSAKLGIDLLQRAAKGEIGAEDANDLYLHYYRAAHPYAEVTEEVMKDYPFKVNASKWRQLIKMGETYKAEANRVMDRALKIREALLGKQRAVLPEFHAMVNVARKQLGSPAKLSDRALTDAVKK